jgi:cysteine synthase A
MLVKNTYDLVGNTPLVELRHIEEEFDLRCHLYAKVELFNPAGSVKDRIALAMIQDAEEKGLLTDESVIIEPTSGNTGIGIASIAAMKGYRCILTMPSSMSIERRKLLKAYGAELVLTDASLGMKGAIAKAEELKETIPHAIILGQFTNPANPLMHYKTTGPEIYRDLNGDVDVFVAGIGTGGTISGVGQYLKENVEGVKIVGVEPLSSAVISGNPAGPHKIQGIGAGFIPETLNLDVVDEISPISNEDAFEFGRLVSNLEGFLVGISSGAALAAAIKEAKKEENEGKNIVVLFPDSGDRYLSTPLFSEE